MELDGAMVRELEPFLRRLAQRAVGNGSVALDLVQETFAAALDPRTTHDPTRGALRSYLAGILMRKVADHYRRRSREGRHADFDETMDSPSGFAPFDAQRALHPIDRERAMKVVDVALAQLPDQQRLAVLACDVEQLDRAEAAASLGVSEAHLRVILHRGRHRLRKALEDARMR